MTVLIVLSEEERLRFGKKIDKTDTCWLWKGGLSGFGHGRFRVGKKLESPHRISYCLYNGSILDGLWVLHRCHNPACVNPEHLYLGDRARNTLDALESGRAKIPVSSLPFERGNKAAAKLNAETVRLIRQRLQATPVVNHLAKEFGVSPKTIRSIRDGKAWSDVA